MAVLLIGGVTHIRLLIEFLHSTPQEQVVNSQSPRTVLVCSLRSWKQDIGTVSLGAANSDLCYNNVLHSCQTADGSDSSVALVLLRASMVQVPPVHRYIPLGLEASNLISLDATVASHTLQPQRHDAAQHPHHQSCLPACHWVGIDNYSMPG